MSRSHKAVADDFLVRPIFTPDQLHDWVRKYTGLKIPRTAVCRNHQAPFEYLRKAYFEPTKDLVVWAPRGGGKTLLAAIATMLDLLHKPGCAVRILGGSLEQSLRMWEHLLPVMQGQAGELLADAGKSSRQMQLINGSSAAALAQSGRAVRGMHVQKLRCDEVEMFQPQIWEAAQLAVKSKSIERGRSRQPGGRLYRDRKCDPTVPCAAPTRMEGAIEAISTHHQRGGLMGKIIDRAMELGKPVIKWCLLEVLEKCPAERKCETCALEPECGGIAKTKCDGFFPIDDAIEMKHRVSKEMWESEMMCRRPSRGLSVFPNFDRGIHVFSGEPSPRPSPGVPGEGGRGVLGEGEIVLAIDFGFHNPFVCLWIVDDGVRCHVLDECVQAGQTMDEHVREMQSRQWGKVKHICCDPAGAARNDQTAESNVRLLRRDGYRVHHRPSRIIDGLELIRAALRPAAGNPTLFVHERCKRLIKALEELSFPKTGGELPFKDGEHDHPVDALRYFYVNRGTWKVGESRSY